MKAPAFWERSAGRYHPAALLLTPLGWLYGAVVAQKLRRRADPLPVPVICLGNVTLGGVGKTPFTDWLAEKLTARGHRVVILSRGYGGTLEGPVEVTPDHTATDVGDEPVMLARRWRVVVAKDRAAGARAAVNAGASVILMDDGYQNPSVYKDVGLLLMAGRHRLGNGRIFPAGPLRESPHAAVSRADAVILVGGSGPLPESGRPTFRAHLTTRAEALPPGPVYAFCGIGHPQKFFDGLRAAGARVVGTRGFPDHHPFTDEEVEAVKEAAAARGATPVCTEKDAARLSASQRQGIAVAGARLTVENEDALLHLIEKTVPPKRSR